jgi:hypothetical protein
MNVFLTALRLHPTGSNMTEIRTDLNRSTAWLRTARTKAPFPSSQPDFNGAAGGRLIRRTAVITDPYVRWLGSDGIEVFPIPISLPLRAASARRQVGGKG